jgi:hypothetical protein
VSQQRETVNGAFVHDHGDHDATADLSPDFCRETETMSQREVDCVSPERARRCVRAVTQNLWGRRGAWPERRAILIAGLRELQPDLIAFQEAIMNEEYDQVRDLVGPDYHVLHSSKREAGDGRDVEAGQGISIARRRARLGRSSSSITIPAGSCASNTSASYRRWPWRRNLRAVLADSPCTPFWPET